MPSKIAIKIDEETAKQIELFAMSMGSKIDSFLVNLNNYVQRQSAMGVSDQQILRNLEGLIQQEIGPFGDLKRDVSKIFENSVVQTSRGFFNANISEKETEKDLREWITVYSGNPSTKHCEECVERHGQVKTVEEWNQIGTPDNAFFDVHISFGVPCHCVLMPTAISRFATNLKEPITL